MKKFVAGMLCGAALMLTTSVFADGAMKQITAYLTPDVSVELDGKKIDLKSIPVNYDDSTYLPLRELAEVVGLFVEWNNDTRTAKLSSHAKISISPPTPTASVQSKPAVSEKPVVIPTITPSPIPTPMPSNNQTESVYYKNCSEAKAKGAYNIKRGEPGYRAALDRDNDGVACEK